MFSGVRWMLWTYWSRQIALRNRLGERVVHLPP